MSDRLPTGLAVNALVRLVDQAGGSAMVLARGDRDSGSVLLVAEHRGGPPQLFERGYAPDGRQAVVQVGPSQGDPQMILDYWQRRRRSDPDLWVVEVNVADAQRLAAETIYAD
ncbi:DUF1491 family protein [Sphingomonas sp. PL-96]|uniref:DUF1491 family protein n=1 Tax=Sphingomonas sp. PL-96 TaxID=2887201 RepID=UPI001E39892A|nr:DUF1491 family protein [Sphingomonas sp. PL-96]MCC2977660.1 DUF1491 family protein [Sphingomonas sp. PL-96]